ncbi:M48 family metallopeptidase [Gandjariella thermophila]|uniref:Zn-dependent protease n=1 Tax=Gandjariella thermophila TaxID=1931992 RepID=A0A4D4J761_9PSEU|nr:M48 family metallopeptidase [Gandjariella thermophila]GDY32625.1 Zn-dependent protease [Gandjariella thermophila]
MRVSVRALQAVGLLAGYYLLTAGALVGLAAFDIVLLTHTAATHVFTEARVIGATVVVAIPLVRGLLMTRQRRGDIPGVAVSPEEQPELWARVRGLADLVGTRPPQEIRLIPQVNAAVTEDVHLLGLLPGRRRMFLGMPLLVGLTSAQLDAVLAHELAHYANHDVRLAAATVRGRAGILAVVRAHPPGGMFLTELMRSLLARYAELYLRVSQSVSRRQEVAADLAAVRVAGRDNVAAALRQLPALDAAYRYYLDRYVSVGWDAGLIPRPEGFYGGLHALLREPARQRALESLRREPPEAEADPYDSHPPLAERVAAIESLPDDGRAPRCSTPPASGLLRDAMRVGTRLALLALPPEAATKRAVDWDVLVRGAGQAALLRAAGGLLSTASAVLRRPVPDLTALLDAVDAGCLDAVADALPKSEPARRASGRLAREFARTAFLEVVRPLVLAALTDAGHARWRHSWARPPHLEFRPGWEAAVAAALAALVAEPPDTRPVRDVLRGIAPEPTPSPTPTGP